MANSYVKGLPEFAFGDDFDWERFQGFEKAAKYVEKSEFSLLKSYLDDRGVKPDVSTMPGRASSDS